MSNFFSRQATIFRNDMARSSGALLGILQGILSDGMLHDREVHFLRDWLDNNKNIAAAYPGNVLCARIQDALADGHISEEERAHLTTTLQQIVGGTLEDLAADTHVTALALDEVDGIEFADRRFCLTGDFVFGPRSICQAAIERRGGQVASSVSKKLSYLVVGGLGSPEWKHGSFGTKIEQALSLRESGAGLMVVHEDAWASSLGPGI